MFCTAEAGGWTLNLLPEARYKTSFYNMLGGDGQTDDGKEMGADIQRTLIWQDIPTELMATEDTTLEYLTTTKIGEKEQLTVPKQFRLDLGLGIGAPFAVLRLGDGLILLPEQQRFEHLCRQVTSSLTAAGLTPDDILATLPQARHRVFARHYGKKSAAKVARHRARAIIAISDQPPQNPPVFGL